MRTIISSDASNRDVQVFLRLKTVVFYLKMNCRTKIFQVLYDKNLKEIVWGGVIHERSRYKFAQQFYIIK